MHIMSCNEQLQNTKNLVTFLWLLPVFGNPMNYPITCKQKILENMLRYFKKIIFDWLNISNYQEITLLQNKNSPTYITNILNLQINVFPISSVFVLVWQEPVNIKLILF
nr:MAG TPA: hypothetical protein [Caudoviricetes sp.]